MCSITGQGFSNCTGGLPKHTFLLFVPAFGRIAHVISLLIGREKSDGYLFFRPSGRTGGGSFSTRLFQIRAYPFVSRCGGRICPKAGRPRSGSAPARFEFHNRPARRTRKNRAATDRSQPPGTCHGRMTLYRPICWRSAGPEELSPVQADRQLR